MSSKSTTSTTTAAASAPAVGNNIDITRDLWKPLKENQIRDMLQELSDLIRSYPSALDEKEEMFAPLRELIMDAIHYPRKYIRKKTILHAGVDGRGSTSLAAAAASGVVGGGDTVVTSPAAAVGAAASLSPSQQQQQRNKRRRLPISREEEAACTAMASIPTTGGNNTTANIIAGGNTGITTAAGGEQYSAAASARAIFTAATTAADIATAATTTAQMYGGAAAAAAAYYNDQQLQHQQLQHQQDYHQYNPNNIDPQQQQQQQQQEVGDHRHHHYQYNPEEPAVGTHDFELQQQQQQQSEEEEDEMQQQQQAQTNNSSKKRKTLATRQAVNYMVQNTLHETPRVVCDRFTKDWNTRFSELEAFRIAYGHTNVSKTYEPNPALGRWVGRQREQYQLWRSGRKTQLTQERAERLTSLGFVWDAQQAVWETKFKELEEFKNRHGHCNYPVRSKDNPKLSTWVTTQRSAKMALDNGQSSSMTPSRIFALDSIGFNWGRTNTSFETRMEQLEEYKKEHGDTDVPKTYHKNQSLAGWVKNTRKDYIKFMNGENSVLDQQRIDQLNGIGFCWVGKDKWERKFDELKAYRDTWGVTHVPYKWGANQSLGAWVRTQKTQKQLLDEGKESTLTPSRVQKLEELGFNFTEESEKSNDFKFNELKSFHDFFGHCNVPEDHPVLGKFVKSQRNQYHNFYKKNKKQSMTDERVEQLNSMNFDWGSPADFRGDDGNRNGKKKSGGKKKTSTTKEKKSAKKGKGKQPPPGSDDNDKEQEEEEESGSSTGDDDNDKQQKQAASKKRGRPEKSGGGGGGKKKKNDTKKQPPSAAASNKQSESTSEASVGV